tara:strand:- start:898 stop:1590 length:693 start_codon:yes stop_codon:yes gene_type:complete
MLYSKINKLKDFFKFDKNRSFRNKLIAYKNTIPHSDHYDYGEGYFYQSLEKINLSGLRSSKDRLENYNIDSFIIDANILDIGCNSGFLIFQLNEIYSKIVGIDHNKALIEMGDMTKDYLSKDKISLIHGDFMKYNFKQKFDVIFSFANHTTYDKGIKDAKKYFQKCTDLLQKRGFLVVESHHPNYEDQQDFMKIIESITFSNNFNIEKQFTIKSPNYYDNERTFIILSKN